MSDLRKLLAAATPGPWECGFYATRPTLFWGPGNGTVPIASMHDEASAGGPNENAALVAHLVNNAERLAACEELLPLVVDYRNKVAAYIATLPRGEGEINANHAAGAAQNALGAALHALEGRSA